MKKHIILAGFITAAVLGVTACGGGNTAKTAAASSSAETTAASSAETTAAETAKESMETSAAAETESTASGGAEAALEPVEGELPTVSGQDADSGLEPVEVVMNKADVAAFAESIKEAVAAKDLQGLLNLCSYPVTVKLTGQEKQVVEESDAFETMDLSKLFSDQLVQAIAAVEPSKLVSSKDGIVMGSKDCGITFTDVEGNLAVTAIVQ